jgi:putative PIN family toxin of toxin-antitoxin system
MRIMLDANIIVSAILFPSSVVARAFNHMIDNYTLVLSQYTIHEVEDVFKEKFPHRIEEMKGFIKKTPYELFILGKIDSVKYPAVRDMDDLPVLANAIESNIDLLVTGDKDFDDVTIEKPRIMKPKKYIDEYIK